MKIAILGLGEAGSHFANDFVKMGVNVSGWDPKLIRELEAEVDVAQDNPSAVKDADIVFSVNYTSESKAIVKEVLTSLKEGAIYCEMNTSSPQTKKEIEQILKASNTKFVDLAIMAPVPPKGIQVPMLASGNGAKLLVKQTASLGMNISYLSEITGEAATRKLLRSIVYKGVAAVICEAIEAGKQLDLEPYMRSQIHSIIGDNDELIDRFLTGSRTHAKRRMHEMEAVVHMLETEKLDAIMSEASVRNLKKYLTEDA